MKHDIPHSTNSDSRSAISTSSLRMFSLVILIGLITIVSGLSGCTSRLRMKLFCETASGRANTKILDAFFVRNRDVGDPLQQDFLISGDGALVALELSISDTSYYRAEVKSSLPIGSRKSLTMRMYWPLPKSLTAKVRGVNRGAFVDMIGNYEASQAERIFQLAHGELIIDSVKSKKLYLTIDATFRSLAGDSLRFDGNVSVKERNQFKFSNTSYHLKDR